MLNPALTALALALTGASAVQALPPPPAIDIPVHESDLADADSIDALRTRIALAARDVCRERVIGDLLRSYTLPDCIEATRAQALAELDALLARRAGSGTTARTDERQ